MWLGASSPTSSRTKQDARSVKWIQDGMKQVTRTLTDTPSNKVIICECEDELWWVTFNIIKLCIRVDRILPYLIVWSLCWRGMQLVSTLTTCLQWSPFIPFLTGCGFESIPHFGLSRRSWLKVFGRRIKVKECRLKLLYNLCIFAAPLLHV